MANSIWRWIVLSHIISQLRPGADLSRVVLPTFILEPRSMLERITKYVFTLPKDGTTGSRWKPPLHTPMDLGILTDMLSL